jgi:hypothetical protein
MTAGTIEKNKDYDELFEAYKIAEERWLASDTEKDKRIKDLEDENGKKCENCDICIKCPLYKTRGDFDDLRKLRIERQNK